MSILCYHAVDPDWQSPLAVTPEAFAEHCRWLSEKRTVLPLAVAVGLLDGAGRLPRGVTALTFDDEFASLAEHAFPVLQRYGLPATVFLVAGTLTAEGQAVDWVDTPPPWPLQTLTRQEVLAAQSSGISFQSHSQAHNDLTSLDPEACEEDLRTSREQLEGLLKTPVPFLAYPRGRHNAQVRAATRRAGFTHGFALPEGSEPVGAHSVPRAGVFPGNGTKALAVKTARRYVAFRQSRVFPLVRAVMGRPPLS